MKTKNDVSYGIIPLRKEGGEWKVLLINQKSHIGNNTYWIFPKGHPEKDESPLETAARELKEETSLVAEIKENPFFEIEYDFVFDGVKINKKVVFFVGYIESEYFKIDETEVKEAGWFNLDEATKRIDYKDTKEMFIEVKKYIESL